MRWVVEVADQGNSSRAADRPGVAQSALSQQILDVERELGFELRPFRWGIAAQGGVHAIAALSRRERRRLDRGRAGR
jgi:hypothetical protein